jgi:RNA polymerase sigma-70 factor (ECF subfamily)
MSQPEAQLLSRWAAGDQKAGADLFTMVFPVLVRFFRNKVSLSDCEDLVQKTMMALVEKHDRYRAESSFKSFVLGMGRIEFLRWLRTKQRKQGREDPFEQLSVMDLGTSPSAVAAKHQEEQVLLSALRRIPVELQMVLEMHYWEEMTAAEIAEVIQVPVGTAKSRIRRAKEKLEGAMAEVAASPDLLQRTMADLETWAAQLKDQLAN